MALDPARGLVIFGVWELLDEMLLEVNYPDLLFLYGIPRSFQMKTFFDKNFLGSYELEQVCFFLRKYLWKKVPRQDFFERRFTGKIFWEKSSLREHVREEPYSQKKYTLERS